MDIPSVNAHLFHVPISLKLVGGKPKGKEDRHEHHGGGSI